MDVFAPQRSDCHFGRCEVQSGQSCRRSCDSPLRAKDDGCPRSRDPFRRGLPVSCHSGRPAPRQSRLPCHPGRPSNRASLRRARGRCRSAGSRSACLGLVGLHPIEIVMRPGTRDRKHLVVRAAALTRDAHAAGESEHRRRAREPAGRACLPRDAFRKREALARGCHALRINQESLRRAYPSRKITLAEEP